MKDFLDHLIIGVCTAVIAALLFMTFCPHAEAVEFDGNNPLWVPYDEHTLTIEEITFESAAFLCANLQDGDTIIMASAGGNISAGFRMMNCIQDRDITILVGYAMSIAPVIVFAADQVCLDTIKTGVIGTHMAARTDGVEMDSLAHTEVFFRIQYYMVKNGATFKASFEWVDFMKMATPDEMHMIPSAKYAEMLGSKFIGTCMTYDEHHGTHHGIKQS